MFFHKINHSRLYYMQHIYEGAKIMYVCMYASYYYYFYFFVQYTEYMFV